MMTLTVNGESRTVEDNASLQKFLNKNGPTGKFAVAINGDFVPRSQYAEAVLTDGDEVDIVSPVGGG